MSLAPSMPMFWDAYIADTTHLTTEEHGAYLLLLAAMWRRNGWVPDDDADTARIVGMTKAKWRKTKKRLSSLLIFSDGHITQKNLQKIWKNTQEKIATNRANGAKGGRPKSQENNTLTKPNGSFSDNPNETIPEPEPDTKKELPNGSSKERAENDDASASGNSPIADPPEKQLDVGGGEGADKPPRSGKPKAASDERRVKRRIDEHCKPDQVALAYAEQRGVCVEREWPNFVDYHVKQDTRSTERGWAAAWRTWCRKAVEFAERDKRVAGPGRKEGKPADWLEAFAMAEQQSQGVSPSNSGGGSPWRDDKIIDLAATGMLAARVGSA